MLTRDWNVKLGPHVIGTHLDTSAYIEDLDGFFDRIKESNQKTVIFMTFEEAKQQAIERSEWVLCHGIEVNAYHYVFHWDADPEIKEIRKPELDGYIRHRLSLEECLEAFFSACREDVKYTQS